MERSPLELALLAAACLGFWTAAAGVILAKYWLAAAGALAMLLVVGYFLRGKD